jgi:hypothetical protein
MPAHTSSHETIKDLDNKSLVALCTLDWGNRLLAVAAALGNSHSEHTVNRKLEAQPGPSCLPMTVALPLVRALPSVTECWHAAMGWSDRIELLVVLHASVCVPLCCRFSADCHDGQHGCLSTTTASRVQQFRLTQLIIASWSPAICQPTTHFAEHLHLPRT